MMSFHDHVVQISTPVKEGYNICTGIWITHDLILTSRHGIPDENINSDQPLTIRFLVDQEPTKNEDFKIEIKDIQEKIVWAKGDECDAVLLKCKMPDEISHKNFIQLCDKYEQGTHNVNWTGRGFPIVMANREAQKHKPLTLSGDFRGNAQNEFSAQVTITPTPKKTDDYKGISGMSVVSNCNRLIGIVKTINKPLEGKIANIVLLKHLLSYDCFQRAVKKSNEQNTQQINLKKNLKSFVKNNHKILTSLNFDNIAQPEKFVEEILGLPPEKWLNRLLLALKSSKNHHPEEKMQAIDRIYDLTMHTLPLLIQPGLRDVLQQIADGTRAQTLALNVVTTTVAEFAMASIEDCAASFIQSSLQENQDAIGEFSIQTLPFSGRNSNMDLIKSDLVETTELRSIDEKYLKHLTKQRLWDQFTDLEKRTQHLNKRLESAHKQYDRRYYYAAIFKSPEEREKGLSTLAELKKTFPKIVFFALSIDEDTINQEEEKFPYIEHILSQVNKKDH